MRAQDVEPISTSPKSPGALCIAKKPASKVAKQEIVGVELGCSMAKSSIHNCYLNLGVGNQLNTRLHVINRLIQL